MGTTSKITEKRIKKKIKWGAYVATPLITLGIFTLLIQLFFSPFSSDFMSLNFDLGKLWPWANQGNKIEEVQVSNNQPKDFNSYLLEESSGNKLQRLRELSGIETVVKPRRAKDMGTTEDKANLRTVQFDQIFIKPVEVGQIDHVEHTFGKINLAEKEYLVHPEMNVNRSRFAVGVSFAPVYSYRTFSYRTTSAKALEETGQSRNYRNRYDQPILNFYGGLDIFFNVNSRWTIQSGLHYSSMGEQLYIASHGELESNQIGTNEPDRAFADFSTKYESPEMVESSRDKIPFNNYYGYLEIPLLANYRLWAKDNINFDIQGGVSYAYLNHVDAMVYDFDSDAYYWISKRSFEYLNRHNVNAYMGVSVSQYITPNVEMFANPQFRIGLNPTFSEEYPVKQHQYSAGIRLGMKVNL